MQTATLVAGWMVFSLLLRGFFGADHVTPSQTYSAAWRLVERCWLKQKV